ncbi:MAG: hypothetical protein KGN76_17880 [Acidobacteriota bacterium]|nr:hypothetical protein [Acidobacteriota bacterium]
MIRVSLEEAVAGQKVARAVTTPTGTVLLQAGEVLTDEVIAGLKRKGVDHLVVEGDDRHAVRSVSEQLADLDVRFAGLEDHPLMMELKDLVAQQIAQGASGGNR